jgi:photosystem II stability/assembly factor-like uncharacterized protein
VRTLPVVAIHAAAPRQGYLGSLVVHGDRVFACGGTNYQPTLLVSEDRGHRFAPWPAPNTPGLRDVHVDRSADGRDEVWVVGERGMVAKTYDGSSWTTVASPSEDQCLYSVMRDDEGRMWILGDGGLVMRINKTGKRFTRVENKCTARLLYMMIEEGCVWLLDSGGMLQRTRGGFFEEVKLAAMRTKRPLCALVRTPAKTLLLLGDRGLVLRSTNNGDSWKKIPVESRNDLEKLLVTPYGVFVVGDHGSVLVSHDDGRSFQGLDTGVDVHLWSIALIDGDQLLGGDQGHIWRVQRSDLAELVRVAFETTDPVIAGLAARLRDGDEGADLVLADALRERELY